MIQPVIRRHDLRIFRETIGNGQYPRLQRSPKPA
jgi:hypothetical protein